MSVIEPGCEDSGSKDLVSAVARIKIQGMVNYYAREEERKKRIGKLSKTDDCSFVELTTYHDGGRRYYAVRNNSDKKGIVSLVNEITGGNASFEKRRDFYLQIGDDSTFRQTYGSRTEEYKAFEKLNQI